MNVHKSGGYISQRLEDNSPFLSTERNSIDFMFLTQDKDGLIFYMGQDKDYLLVQLVNGSMRVRANLGGKGKLFCNRVKECKGLFNISTEVHLWVAKDLFEHQMAYYRFNPLKGHCPAKIAYSLPRPQ